MPVSEANPTCPSSKREHQPRHDNSIPCKFVWQIYRDKATEKLHRMSQVSNFCGGSFSNRDSGRAPIQYRKEKQSKRLKRLFFFKNKLAHFHISSTRVIRLTIYSNWAYASPRLHMTCCILEHSIFRTIS